MASGEFAYQNIPSEPKGSALYQEHLKLIDKSRLANFAGYLMPLWFSSIKDEHNAVRKAAGLFDCTHMGAIEIRGKDSQPFIDAVCTNDISTMADGQTRYAYILDAAGRVLDDIIVYRFNESKFMLVVNAANEPKIKAYLSALLTGKVVIDVDEPAKRLTYSPAVRDMRDCSTVADCRVDIALQGPRSTEILYALADGQSKKLIADLKPFYFTQTDIQNINCIISRTGYTGQRIAFELFVHPDNAPKLWQILLDKGKSYGLIPCGLGARDSLRIEAGLPLYGHELDGSYNITPFEAGYGWAVKLDKEFFIGKDIALRQSKQLVMTIARLELSGAKGIRPVRQNDAVLNEEGRCIGHIVSAAQVGDKQIALAYIEKQASNENDPIGIYYLARNQNQILQGKKENIQISEMIKSDLNGKILTRFAKF